MRAWFAWPAWCCTGPRGCTRRCPARASSSRRCRSTTASARPPARSPGRSRTGPWCPGWRRTSTFARSRVLEADHRKLPEHEDCKRCFCNVREVMRERLFSWKVQLKHHSLFSWQKSSLLQVKLTLNNIITADFLKRKLWKVLTRWNDLRSSLVSALPHKCW